MAEMDFPANPDVGQKYMNDAGVVYAWNGEAWVFSYFDTPTETLITLGDLLLQIRILLQDTDTSAGQYRYSTESIILCINQCMADLFRIRPDLFLENGYKIPVFNSHVLDASMVIEYQYIPPVVYYAVGLVQVRDDEQNQDSRALAFLKVFQNAVVNGGIAA